MSLQTFLAEEALEAEEYCKDTHIVMLSLGTFKGERGCRKQRLQEAVSGLSIYQAQT